MSLPPRSRPRPPAASTAGSLDFEVPAPPARASRQPRGAAEWVAHVREQDMPAFGATVALVHEVTEDERATIARLAQVILQDAAMTAKVLKLANSAFYNPNRQPASAISTISRAIVVLGFNIVAEIALGIVLVDALLKGGVRRRVIGEMARSFHAAVQARAVARMRGDTRSEEVFIAALLMRVGEMAFWCFGGETAERLDQRIAAGAVSEEDAQQAELGFRLSQLSRGLAREWKLGGLLQAVLDGAARPGAAEQSIRLAHRLAAAVEGGWETAASRRVVQDLADFVEQPVDVVRGQLAANAEEAARIASYYGADEAARSIPLPGALTHEAVLEEDKAEHDPLLQLKILRELSGRIGAGASLNEVLQLVLEGIYRGIGFDRVLFALLTPGRQQLVAKTGLGTGAEALCRLFVFSLQQKPDDLLDDVFRRPRAIRLAPGQVPDGLRGDRLFQVTAADTACLAPIVANGRAIGLFYADRGHEGASIDDESFDAFQLFVQQVSLAVSRVAGGGRKG